MSFEKIPDSELNKLLSVYDIYKLERLEDDTPFLQLLTWIEQKQTPQIIVERICQPGEIIIRENEPGTEAEASTTFPSPDSCCRH